MGGIVVELHSLGCDKLQGCSIAVCDIGPYPVETALKAYAFSASVHFFSKKEYHILVLVGAGVGEGRVIDLLSTDIEGSSPGRPGIVDIVPSHKADGLESPGFSIETIKDILLQSQHISGKTELIAYSNK